MLKPLFLAILCLFFLDVQGQTCTVTGTSPLNWPTNGSGIVCAEGGNAVGKSILVIPAGFEVTLDDNGDTWDGTQIEIYGTLNVPSNPRVNSNIIVKTGGLLNINGKLELGSNAASCDYHLAVGPGGTVTAATTGADRLTICGTVIIKGGGAGSCNDCGGTNSAQCPYDNRPYCQPPGGFTGPAGYDRDGFDVSLPIKISYFSVELRDQAVGLEWATSLEENFQKFIIQRSSDGMAFEDIGEVPGRGFNIYDIETKYAFEDDLPFIGTNYYRLTALDLDGSYERFGVRMINVKAAKDLRVYPNPVSAQTIALRLNFTPGESDRILLVDQRGVVVYNALTAGNTRISFPVDVAAGIYVLKYVSNQFHLTTKVLIKE